VLEEDPLAIRRAMRHNTGQCIPLNIIAEEAMDYVERHGLDPASTALWMPAGAFACNFPLFPTFIKSLFEARGGGMEHLGVYSRDFSLVEFGPRAALRGYRAALVGGLLRRVGCRLRPYEAEPGALDRALQAALGLLIPAFSGDHPLRETLCRAAALFDSVATVPGRRPKVAIFGDLYVRDNDVMSQELIRAIEEAGGEVVTSSLIEYWRIVIGSYRRRWRATRDYRNLLVTRTIWNTVEATGRPYAQPIERFLGPPSFGSFDSDEWVQREFGVRDEHSGESLDNLLKVFHVWRGHRDLRLFVRASPAFCCPSLVTEAMARDIRRLTGVPVVSITYDGTAGYRNDALVPYLRFARGLGREEPSTETVSRRRSSR
jgi:predicted nucleotide-binding protein (sugar kinase/HSP70/actin superfamily)